MSVKKICEFCKKEFNCNFRITRTKYCSPYCRDRKSLTRPARKQYEKEYREKNRDHIKRTQNDCYIKRRQYYIEKSKENKENNPNTPLRRFRSFDYKGQKIHYKFDVRCGVCNLCRAVEKIDTYSTQRHHDKDKYYDENPLKNTIEVCVNCHGKLTFNKNYNA